MGLAGLGELWGFLLFEKDLGSFSGGHMELYHGPHILDVETLLLSLSSGVFSDHLLFVPCSWTVCVCVWMSWRPVLSLGIYILQIYRILHKSQVFCLMDFHKLNTLIYPLIRWRNNIITSSVSGDTRFHLPPPKEMCSLTSEGMASFILLLCLIHTESNRIYFILWLALFSIMFVRSVYIFAHSCTYFHSWIVLYNMAISVYLFYSLNLGCFLMLAVRNSVAVNLLIWLLVNVCSYFFWVHT